MANKKLKLAILDDYFDIASSKFKHLRTEIDVVEFPRTLNANNDEQRQSLVERLQPFEVVSSMRERTRFPAEVLDSLPNLKVIMTTGMRNAAIPLEKCKELGIIVAGAKGTGRSDTTSKPHANSLDATAEHGWALILSLARNIVNDHNVVTSGGWQTESAMVLRGKTIGLLGLGKLGAMTAKTAVYGFGMKIIAWSSSLTQEGADAKAQEAGLPAGTYRVVSSKADLCKEADIVSVHYVLSDRSRGIIGAEELSLMKPTAMLVNTSRGPLIDEDALLDVLRRGAIRGAALDVYDIEPLPKDSPWRTTKWGTEGRSKVVLSPHMGYVEEEVMQRWYDEHVENVERYLRGQPLRNVIEPQ